ncbi:MAG: TetR/AcrR family transcriptional regulator [Acidimicrobiales bacterium]|nr:TetR/AcrR family transcriptional regulator [Acidimicrobiales bacterium]
MARRHGWAGSPPADEREARARIVEAAMRVVDRRGPDAFTLADVANDLGITRPTVYRYFTSTEDLFAAVGQTAVEVFVDDITGHLSAITDPVEWTVEATAMGIERVPNERYLTLLLVSGRSEQFTRGITSEPAMEVGRELFKRSSVDWSSAGFDPEELDELIELLLRVLQSMVVDPPQPTRTGGDLRRYLRRWIAPAVAERSG